MNLTEKSREVPIYKFSKNTHILDGDESPPPNQPRSTTFVFFADILGLLPVIMAFRYRHERLLVALKCARDSLSISVRDKPPGY
jgi:hypothetical protein